MSRLRACLQLVRPEDCALLALLASLALLVPACSDDSSPRSVITIESINGGQILTSDVYNNGDDGEWGTDDDFIIEDQVPIVVRNTVHDKGLNVRPNGPYGAVVLERFEIRFLAEDGATIAPITGGLNIRVVSGSTAQGEVTVIPAGLKVAPPLVSLQMGGEFRFTAEITLTGREEDSNAKIETKGLLPVHVANWGDE